MDITLIMSIIGWILTPITTYVIAKSMFNSNRITSIVEDLIEEISTNEELQKKLYLVGAYVGKGLMDGTGIQTRGGKMKWQDLAMQIGAELAKKYLHLGETQQQAETVNPFAQR